jgi:Protein of unknown function (DUF1566)
MKIRRSKWVSRIGAVGLAVGCLALAGLGSGATPAEAEDSPAAASRFVVLEAFNNEAALDNETGLVWETIPARAATVWKNASGICAKKTVGGKKGWRLPTVKELATLADHTIYPPPALPPGHPFSNIEFFGYWTATEHEDYTMSAWDVNFDYGLVGNDFKTNTNFVWCVRDAAK